MIDKLLRLGVTKLDDFKGVTFTFRYGQVLLRLQGSREELCEISLIKFTLNIVVPNGVHLRKIKCSYDY